MEVENIFTSILPLYYFAKLLGMASYKPIEFNNRIYFKKDRSNLFYGYFMQTILQLITIYVFICIVRSNLMEPIMKIIFLLQANCLLLFSLAIFGSYVCFNGKFICILNKLVEIDSILEQMSIIPDYKIVSNYFLGIILIEIIWYVIYIGISFYTNTQNFPYFIAHLIFIWFSLIIFLYLTGFTVIHELRLLALNTNLYDVFNNNKNNMVNPKTDIANAIRDTSNLYKRLIFNAKTVNDIFSIQILVYVVLIFLIEVSHLYKICSSIIQHDTNETNFKIYTTSIYWSLYFGYKLLLLTHLCGQLSQSVSIKVQIFNTF